jgi:hypothetical protein
MQRFPKEDPRPNTGQEQPPLTRSELEGFVDLGMKDEALRLARQQLRASGVNALTFNESVQAILILADKAKPWRRLIESAHERLPRSERQLTRFKMMAFRKVCSDYQGVLRLLPKRLPADFSGMELSYAMKATFELGDRVLMGKLARRLPAAIQNAEHPIIHSQLLLCLAEFLMLNHDWEEAINVLEAAQTNEILSQNAVRGIVEIQAVRALLALRCGFELIEEFNRNFDPMSELTLPGSDREVQELAAKEFRRLRKILERVVPSKRQKALGIA